jgi:3-hydroxybutyryl-CoA dehydrogenase
MEIRKVGVVGCGLMGSGIAQVSAQAGYETWVRETDDERLKEGIGSIEEQLLEKVESGKMTEGEMTEVLDRINGTTKLDDLRKCELVIESVNGDVALKKRVFSELDRTVGKAAILATSASSISVSELASVTKRPDRIIGLRFKRPIHAAKVVEIVRTSTVGDEGIEAAVAFVESLGKEPVVVKDISR